MSAYPPGSTVKIDERRNTAHIEVQGTHVLATGLAGAAQHIAWLLHDDAELRRGLRDLRVMIKELEGKLVEYVGQRAKEEAIAEAQRELEGMKT